MPPAKALFRRVAEGVLVLLLFLAPWPKLDRAFTSAYCGVANALGVRAELERGIATRLVPASELQISQDKRVTSWHVVLEVENVASHATTRYAINTRNAAYVPLAAFLALLLASRLLLKLRRPEGRWALALGSLAMFGFVTLALGLSCLRFLALPRVGAVELDPKILRAADMIYDAVIVPPGMAYVVPAFVTALMLYGSSFRKLDFDFRKALPRG